MSGRLLALSHTMPPLIFPRSLQISRTLKALRAHGWKTDIVTVQPAALASDNSDALLERLYVGQYRRILIEPREDVQASAPRLAVERLATPPADLTQDNWLRRAEWAMVWRLWTFRYSAMVTFAQPWMDHVIGLAVRAKTFNAPWVAHFSDPWVDSPYIAAERLPPGQIEVWRRQEREVAEKADALIFVTQETADLVMGKYPAAWSKKVHIVPHGYDSDLLPLLRPRRPSAKLTLTYTGNLFPPLRLPTALLKALAELNEAAPLDELLQVNFVGFSPPESMDLAASLKLDRIVKFHGRTDYLSSLQFAAEADILLVIDAPFESSVFLPSKLVDYLMFKKPILGLTPQSGAAASLLMRCGHPVVAPDDQACIKTQIAQALDRHRRGVALGVDSGDVAETYDVNHATIGFDAALRAAIARKRLW
jgi:glycosyltransferase involved in cell wall biosynthesis